MIRLALYQPDIPQNTGAAMRLCACLAVGMDVIGPCGFVWDERRIRRAGMDYIDSLDLVRHDSWDEFIRFYGGGRRIVLLSAHARTPYTGFTFRTDDILLAGRESAGVPEAVRDAADYCLTIPLAPGLRSLNVVTAAAMVLGEAKRQIGERTGKGADSERRKLERRQRSVY